MIYFVEVYNNPLKRKEKENCLTKMCRLKNLFSISSVAILYLHKTLGSRVVQSLSVTILYPGELK